MIHDILKKGGLALACVLMSIGLASCSKEQAANAPQSSGQKNAASAGAPVTIKFWHGFTGQWANVLNIIVDDFNETHPKYKVLALDKAGHGSSFRDALAVEGPDAPDILQVYEFGTPMMLHSGKIEPVGPLSARLGDPIKKDKFYPAIASYYSGADGELQSMPFNSSTAVLFYNKDMFKEAGLDPERPPKTWAEVKEYGDKFKAIGKCAYTTTWPSWVFLETFSSWHNIYYATEDNGFGGLNAKLSLEDPAYERLFTLLADMSRDGEFVYTGQDNAKPMSMFRGGECAMLTSSSASIVELRLNKGFSVGVSKMPYLDDVPGAPQNTLIGGGSLWVMKGRDDEKYKGIVEFLKFLTDPNEISLFVKETGYIPVTKEGYRHMEAEGYFDHYPEAKVPLEQLDVSVTSRSQGLRLGNLDRMRTDFSSIMEKIFSGQMTPRAGLDEMRDTGNKELEEFREEVEGMASGSASAPKPAELPAGG